MHVRISLFLFAMAVAVGLLHKHFPESLVGSITPAVAYLAVLAITVVFFGMISRNSGSSRMLRKVLS